MRQYSENTREDGMGTLTRCQLHSDPEPPMQGRGRVKTNVWFIQGTPKGITYRAQRPDPGGRGTQDRGQEQAQTPGLVLKPQEAVNANANGSLQGDAGLAQRCTGRENSELLPEHARTGLAESLARLPKELEFKDGMVKSE